MSSDRVVNGTLSVIGCTLDISNRTLTVNGPIVTTSNPLKGAQTASTGIIQGNALTTLIVGGQDVVIPPISGGVGTLEITENALLGGEITVWNTLKLNNKHLSLEDNDLLFEGSTFAAGTEAKILGGWLKVVGTGNLTLPNLAVIKQLLLDRDGYTMTLGGNLLVDGYLTIDNGTLDLSTYNLTLKKDLETNGTGAIIGTGSILPKKVNGTNPKLKNAKVNNLAFNDAEAGAEVEGGLTVSGTITFGTGTLELAGNTLDLGTTGTITGETSTSRVTNSTGAGKIRSQRTINNGTADYGLGMVMSSTGNLGAPIVDRYLDYTTSNGANSIKRRVVWSNFTASNDPITLSITYTDDDLNNLNANDLVLFVRNRNSSIWSKVGNSVKVGNTVTGTFAFTTLPSFAPENGSQQSRFMLSGEEGEGTLGDGFSLFPVELVSFSGMMRNEKVQLAWKTATETNNYGFEVERSVVADPKASVENAKWNTIGFVAGNGTTSSERSYSFSDDVSTGALQQVEHFAYRLRQIDRDGTTDYSPVVFVSRSVQEPVALALDMPYPNPTENESFATVRLAESRIVTVQLVSVDGKVLETIAADQQLDAGVHSFRISRGTLPAGVYFVVVQSAELRVVRPLTIVR
jgi:hypothetical protein